LNASLLRGLVAGRSFDEVCERLAVEYSPDDVAAQRAELEAHYDRIRHHAPLRTLFNCAA
jgi:hypothetical protein